MMSDKQPISATWKQRFQQLKQFKAKQGHCDVLRRYKDNPRLANWAWTQRQVYRKGTLSRGKIEFLESIGFTWELSITVKWQQRFEQLKQLKEKQGGCNVSLNYNSNPRLANWLAYQKKKLRDNTLSRQKRLALDAIGISADKSINNSFDERWYKHFQSLMQFKKTYGHCDVPHRYKDNPTLANWVWLQRQAHRQGTLKSERVALLEQAEFTWEPHATKWPKSFEELKKFKSLYGHCDVSLKYGCKPSFVNWVCEQRRKYKKQLLPREKIDLLKGIGFTWEWLISPQWLQRLAQLKQFKACHGHYRVPFDIHNIQLARWKSVQKARYKKGKLSKEHIKQLKQFDSRFFKATKP